MQKVISYTGIKAWDIIWKWKWFASKTWRSDFRYQHQQIKKLFQAFNFIDKSKTILDCSCGIGFSTIAFSDLGFQVFGSDASPLAIKYARLLAIKEKVNIKYFKSKWEQLYKKHKDKFDYIYNDSFDWIPTRKSMQACAKSFYNCLKKDGLFFFQGINQWDKSYDIEKQLAQDEKFILLDPLKKEGIKLTVFITKEAKPDGISGNRIHIIEKDKSLRVEIASIMDFRKWQWQNFNAILRKVGFKKVYSIRSKGGSPFTLNVAEKMSG